MNDKKDLEQVNTILYILIIVSACLYVHVQLREQTLENNPVIEATVKPFADLFIWSVTPSNQPAETPTPSPTNTPAQSSTTVPYVTPTLRSAGQSVHGRCCFS